MSTQIFVGWQPEIRLLGRGVYATYFNSADTDVPAGDCVIEGGDMDAEWQIDDLDYEGEGRDAFRKWHKDKSQGYPDNPYDQKTQYDQYKSWDLGWYNESSDQVVSDMGR